MRILSIHMNSTLNGGAEVVFFSANHLMAERAHQVAWFTIGKLPESIRQGAPEYVIPEIPDGNRYAIKKFARHFYNVEARHLAEKAIREFKPDVVHLHTVFGYRYLSPAVLLPFKQAGIPVVQTLHDYGLLCPASFLLTHGQVCESCRGGKYFFAGWKRCIDDNPARSTIAALNAYFKDHFYHYDDLIAGYIAPSQFLRQKYVEFGYAPEKIELIPNAFFRRATLQVNFSPKRRDYVLYAGRLSREKGVDVLVRAAKGLGFPVKIAGEGPELENLRALVQELQVEQIEFIGKQPHESMSALYRNAALTLLTSRWYENGPLVVLESFSEKTPVVGARIGAIPEFVRDGETGFLFTPNDPDDLRRVIQSALQNPASLDALEENAYRYVCEKHAPALYADRLEHTLQGHLAAQ